MHVAIITAQIQCLVYFNVYSKKMVAAGGQVWGLILYFLLLVATGFSEEVTICYRKVFNQFFNFMDVFLLAFYYGFLKRDKNRH